MKVFKVAKIVDSTTIYITGGIVDGIKQGDKFEITSKKGVEIKDPDTHEVLEIVPGAKKAIVYAKNVFNNVSMVKPVNNNTFMEPLVVPDLLNVNPFQITGNSLDEDDKQINIGDTVLYLN